MNYDDICPGCEGTGWESIKGPVRYVRKCEQCDFWARLRGQAPGIPEMEREARLANFDPNIYNVEAVKHAGLFVEGVHQGIYLHGPVGTGKTRLVCSILNDLWAKGDRVRFMRVPELLIRLQPDQTDAPNGLIGELSAVPVLALDDVGANQGTDFSRRMIQILFDARADRDLRTIWTSNLTLDELTEFLRDERLTSRISGTCRIVELDGPDQRPARKKTAAKAPKTRKPAGGPKPWRKDTTNHGRSAW